MKRAWSTHQQFEMLRKLNKGQCDEWLRRDGPEVRVQERFSLYESMIQCGGGFSLKYPMVIEQKTH